MSEPHELLELIGEVIWQHGHIRSCDCSWDDEHHTARAVIEALGLTEETTPDIAGPEWATYTRWVTPTTTHHGPRYNA